MRVMMHSQKRTKNEQILKEPALMVNPGDLTAFFSNLERPNVNFCQYSEKIDGLRSDYPPV